MIRTCYDWRKKTIGDGKLSGNHQYDASQNMQGKLLRVMEDKTTYMVGSTRALRVGTRLIAATSKDLLHLVNKGIFREDLFYRLMEEEKTRLFLDVQKKYEKLLSGFIPICASYIRIRDEEGI